MKSKVIEGGDEVECLPVSDIKEKQKVFEPESQDFDSNTENDDEEEYDEKEEVLESDSEELDSDMENDDDDEEESDNGDDDADDEGDDEESTQKSGWADAMSKVLNSAKASEPSQVVLSKARKDYEVKNKTLQKSDETEESKKDTEEPKTSKLKQSSLRSKKLAIESVGRSLPEVVRDKAKEKNLNRIATKGVVQLFNAVKKQQVDIKKDLNSVGKSVRKREKVYQSIDKNSFLENVLGAKTSKGNVDVVPPEEPIKKGDEESMEVDDEGSYPKSWSVLRDDFMMGAKMKDWDKNSDSEG